jgi:hypothetical protein
VPSIEVDDDHLIFLKRRAPLIPLCA